MLTQNLLELEEYWGEGGGGGGGGGGGWGAGLLQGQAFVSDSEKFDHTKIDHDNIMFPWQPWCQ